MKKSEEEEEVEEDPEEVGLLEAGSLSFSIVGSFCGVLLFLVRRRRTAAGAPPSDAGERGGDDDVELARLLEHGEDRRM